MAVYAVHAGLGFLRMIPTINLISTVVGLDGRRIDNTEYMPITTMPRVKGNPVLRNPGSWLLRTPPLKQNTIE